MSKAAIKLQRIQSTLNAPKNLENKFGNYRYRSAESILEALKPHLQEQQAILTLSDEIIEVGGRIYIKATATFTTEGDSVSTTAFAREAESKKGMDDAQVTGACSSYARKYALNGLFCIDDTKDADYTETHGKITPIVPKQDHTPSDMITTIITALRAQTTLSDLNTKMDKAKSTAHSGHPMILAAYNETKEKLK